MPLFFMFPLFEKYLDSFIGFLLRSETRSDVKLCNGDHLATGGEKPRCDAQDHGAHQSRATIKFEKSRSRSNHLVAVALPPLPAALTAQDTVYSDADKSLMIFENLVDAIEFCKKNKSASPRWKQVADTTEAETFSSHLFTATVSDGSKDILTQMKNNRESIGWRMPKSQETVKLRKTIETGTTKEVHAIISSNPRFLIGSGDTPTVLQEGCRYNAFHIAAKADRPDMLSLVVHTLRSKSFMKMMYPNDTDKATESRMAFLIDLYLNMPDKTRTSETPLHFACKFGSVECVRLLLDQAECDRSVKNGEGLEAQEIICERAGKQPALVRKIKSLFEERFVIPILRDEDGDCLPRVGAPVTPKQLDSMLYSPQTRTPRSGKRVSAIVGPVTSPVASEVMAELTSTRLRPTEMQIRRTDAEKGLESVVRQVARRYGVPWKERWDFLDCDVDLASSEGLKAFEKYLKRQYDTAEVRFVMGERATKTDYHVWSALEPILHGIDRAQMPFIGQWTDNMKRYTRDEMRTWKTPIKYLCQHREKGAGDDADCIINLMSRYTNNDQ